MSDGHLNARAGVERETYPREVTDDGEIELNLPREDTDELDRQEGTLSFFFYLNIIYLWRILHAFSALGNLLSIIHIHTT